MPKKRKQPRSKTGDDFTRWTPPITVVASPAPPAPPPPMVPLQRLIAMAQDLAKTRATVATLKARIAGLEGQVAALEAHVNSIEPVLIPDVGEASAAAPENTTLIWQGLHSSVGGDVR